MREVAEAPSCNSGVMPSGKMNNDYPREAADPAGTVHVGVDSEVRGLLADVQSAHTLDLAIQPHCEGAC